MTIEESAKKLGDVTQETISENFSEGKKMLEASIEKNKDINIVLEGYTQGNGIKVASKIRQLEKEKELLEIGKNTIDYFLELNDDSKYEEIKQDFIINRRFKLVNTMKYVADSLKNEEKYAKSRTEIYNLYKEMVSMLKKEFVNYKEMNNNEKINVF